MLRERVVGGGSLTQRGVSVFRAYCPVLFLLVQKAMWSSIRSFFFDLLLTYFCTELKVGTGFDALQMLSVSRNDIFFLHPAGSSETRTKHSLQGARSDLCSRIASLS